MAAGPVPSSAVETESRLRAIEALVRDEVGTVHDGRLSQQSLDGQYVSAVVLDPAFGDDFTDATAHIVAKLAEAEAAGKAVFVPEGIYRHSTPIVLDWNGATLIGEGRRLSQFRMTATDQDGVTFGPSSGITYNGRIRGVSFLGPGSGTGVGVNMGSDAVANGYEITDCQIQQFGSYGLVTKFTDYLHMTAVRLIDNGAGCWLGQQATNATLVEACTFAGEVNAEPPVVPGIVAEDIDGLVMLSSEFGDLTYGIDVGAAGGIHWHVAGCRWERMENRFIRIGSGAFPVASLMRFDSCSFQRGTRTMSTGVELRHAVNITFNSCSWTDNASGAVFVKNSSSTVGNKNIVVENCSVATGGVIMQDTGSVNQSNTRNVYGADFTGVIQAPYGLLYPLGDTTATRTVTLGMVPHLCTVTAVEVTVDTLVSADVTNYWDVTVQRYASGSLQGTVASRTFNGGTSFLARRSTALSLGAQTTLARGDVLVAVLTKTGSAADLEDLSIMVSYNPIA